MSLCPSLSLDYRLVNGPICEVVIVNIKRISELVSEMTRRGYNHKSPLPEFQDWIEGHVDSSANVIELARRCPECRKRIEENYQ